MKLKQEGSKRICMVTDVGTRTLVVVHWTQEQEQDGWFHGPPYPVLEFVLDEDDLILMEPTHEI